MPPIRIRIRNLLPGRMMRRSMLQLLMAFVVLELWHCYLRYNHQSRALSAPPSSAPVTPYNRVYIAAQHRNAEELLREEWNSALLDLIRGLGPDNVFVSIGESGSWDNTKDALRELDAELGKMGVKKRITLSNTTHADALAAPTTTYPEGWIDNRHGGKLLRRMPYLASIRNKVLEPLATMEAQGERYRTILWLGDVVFSPADVFKLLKTNGGEFAAACSMDFDDPRRVYDTFALRDSKGHAAMMQTWPWFRSSRSREAAVQFQPIRVASCWNGIVAMRTITDLARHGRLRFRAIDDSLAALHVEASECCLIHADNTLSRLKGVWLNPNVKVGESKMDDYEHAEFCLVDDMQIITEDGWRHVGVDEVAPPSGR